MRSLLPDLEVLTVRFSSEGKHSLTKDSNPVLTMKLFETLLLLCDSLENAAC